MVTEKMVSVFLRALQNIQYGNMAVTLPNGQTHHYQGTKPGPQAIFQIHDHCVVKNLVLQGDIGFAEDYRAGHWDSPDIAALIEVCLRNATALHAYIYGNRLRQMLARFAYRLMPNNKRGSRKNIQAHYDLGNAFYALWLDPSMTYSSALYAHENQDLTQAQQNKYHRIWQQLGEDPQHILEIGCGWGGFAEHACQNNAQRITGITLSPAQHQYAGQRLAAQTQADIQLTDYRDVQGRYDAIVSIEMFEAVGERYWRTYFDKIKALLTRTGQAVIQTITIDEAHFADYRRSGDAIRSYIFPGGMLPSPERFEHNARQAGLRLINRHAFGQDYARTLLSWLDRFDAQTAAVQAQSFDQPFIRLWRFYLAFCAGAFAAERTSVMQATLCHA